MGNKDEANKFYVTTPIYYVNDIPHIGHAYTTIAADILARYNRIRGRRVFFLTGTDEHGQKVQKAAGDRGLSPLEHADRMVENFKGLWKALDISHDAFIRTTDPEHKKIVQKLLQELWDKRLIEKRTYSGWYCTPDERFWTEKDLAEGKCPDCGRDVEKIEEQNYFFLMSRYQEALINYIEQNPSYIRPGTRRNEVLGFLKGQPLGDLCISRPAARLSWGIPLPFDGDFVTYVWFDALVNYYSALSYLAPGDIQWWPADAHLIGKDILTTHAVYWSCMLMALGFPLPGTIFAHGWWTIEGRKMSKSLGNVAEPKKICEKLRQLGLASDAYQAVDALRYFLMREIPFGHDGDFSEEAIITRINTELANDLGNLTTRALTMAVKYFNGTVPRASIEPEMKALAQSIPPKVKSHLDSLQFQKALEEIWDLVSYANKYIESNAPWNLAKSPETHGRLAEVVYSALEALKYLAVYLYPFMPSMMETLWAEIGYPDSIEELAEKNALDKAIGAPLPPGSYIGQFKALFPRIVPPSLTKATVKVSLQTNKAPSPQPSPAGRGGSEAEGEGKKETPAMEESSDNLISIEEFARTELKTGKVMKCEAVKGSSKLLRLEVDLGEEAPRQVIAGIGKKYMPEELEGKTVIIVSNLKPASLMGLESRGMLLAATDSDGVLSILTTGREIKPGAKIK